MKRLVTVALATTGVMAVVLSPVGPASAADPVLGVDARNIDKLVSVTESAPATFGGASIDEAHHTVTVRYVEGQAAARSRLRGVASPGVTPGAARWRVNMVAVRHSFAELDAVRQKVASDGEWRRLNGDTMSEWYVDIVHNVVSVGVTKLSPSVTAAAKARFGNLVQVHQAARMTPTSSRVDDFAPWAGGIRINSGGSGCTAGFAIEVPGTPATRRMLTAGHCFALGATVTNNGTFVGTVGSRVLANNGKDYETINGNFTGWTYKGPPTSDYGDAIKGAKASVVGQTFCTNGATSGETCSGTVTATNICSSFTDGITRCSLDRMAGDVVLSRKGDSGGNVFTYDADGLKVGGIIIGGSGNTTVFHPVSAVLPKGWRVTTG